MSLLSRSTVFVFVTLVCVAHAEPFGPYVDRYGSSYGGGMSSSQYNSQQAQIARDNARREDQRRQMDAQIARDNAQREDQRRQMDAQIARDNARREDQRRQMDAQIARDNQRSWEQAGRYPSAPRYSPVPAYTPTPQYSPLPRPRTSTVSPRTGEELPPPRYVRVPQSLLLKGWQSPGDQSARTTSYDGQPIHSNTVAWRVNKDGRLEQLTISSPDFVRAQALEVEQGYAHIRAQFKQTTGGWKSGVGVGIPALASEEELDQWWQQNGELFGQSVEKSLLGNGEPALDGLAKAGTEQLHKEYLRELTMRKEIAHAVGEIEAHSALAATAVESSLSSSASQSLPVDQALKEGQRVLDGQRKEWEAKVAKLGRLVAEANGMALGISTGRKPNLEPMAAEQRQRLVPLVNLRRPVVASQAQHASREASLQEMQNPKWFSGQVARLDALVQSKFEPGDFVAHIRVPLLRALEEHSQSRRNAESALENSLRVQKEKTATEWGKIEKQFLDSGNPADSTLLAELTQQAAACAQDSLHEGEAWDAARRGELERRNLFVDIEKQFQSLCESNALVITPIKNAPDYRLEFDLKRNAYLAHAGNGGDATRWERLMEIQKPRHFVQNGSWAAMIAEKVPGKAINPQGWLVLLYEGKLANVVEPLNPHTVHWQLVAQGTEGFRVELQDKKTSKPLQEFALDLGLDGRLSPAPGSAETPSVRPAWDKLPLLP
jgi:hypothetical protein